MRDQWGEHQHHLIEVAPAAVGYRPLDHSPQALASGANYATPSRLSIAGAKRDRRSKSRHFDAHLHPNNRLPRSAHDDVFRSESAPCARAALRTRSSTSAIWMSQAEQLTIIVAKQPSRSRTSRSVAPCRILPRQEPSRRRLAGHIRMAAANYRVAGHGPHRGRVLSGARTKRSSLSREITDITDRLNGVSGLHLLGEMKNVSSVRRSALQRARGQQHALEDRVGARDEHIVLDNPRSSPADVCTLMYVSRRRCS